ncbi:MAG: peptidoglycan-binding domain-containing protein, partial [Actinomycetota bacterium]
LTCVTLTDDGVLRPGDEGADVEALQEDLAALGYLTGDIDGKYGPGTRAAVIAFQTDYLLTRDGRVGPNTRAVLTEVMDGTSLLLLASENGVGAWPFGTDSETAYAGLIGALGVPDSATGWYVDACDGNEWFKARWEGFSVVFTDRSGTRRFDGWEVNDLADLPANLLIAGGIRPDTRWGDLDAMGADFFDDFLGQRWRIPALGYGNGRFVNPVSNPPGAKAAIAGFGTGTGGFESC